MSAGWNKGLQLKEFQCVCGETDSSKFYSKNKMKTCCKKCHNIKIHQKTRAMKARAIEYLGGVCERCNCTGVPAIFDFHHRDPAEKEFSWGDSRTSNWDRLQLELDKCSLLCANCHRTVHDEEWFDTLPQHHPERIRRNGEVA